MRHVSDPPRGIAFGLLLVTICLASAVGAHALSIEVVPGAYAGSWRIEGETGNLSGQQTVDLAPGSYQMRVAQLGLGAFTFSVAASGEVTSQNTTAAVGAGNDLTFNTVPIQIDPAAYSGSWWLFGVTGFESGSQVVTVVPGVGYQMRVAQLAQGALDFTVAANGDVTSQNPTAAFGAGNTLTFYTTTIQIDPAAYAGTWWLFGVLPATLSGSQVTTVVPGVGYQIRVAQLGFGAFDFTVAATGNVTSQNNAAAFGNGNLLTFNTTTIRIDPLGYSGGWWLFGVVSSSGAQNAIVVPGVSYQLRVSGQQQNFAVAEPCAVTPSQFVIAGAAFEVGCGALSPQELIGALIAEVIALNLHHGITNSLDAKLDSALDSLQDANENNDVAAINNLNAFINAVEAQRGNKIPEPDADALIALAQSIIDLLATS